MRRQDDLEMENYAQTITNNNLDSNGTTSFLKTVFNGLNALSGFLIIEGDNLHKLFPELKYEIVGLVLGGRRSFIFIATLVVLPTVWLDDMSSLSYISASGIIAFFILIGSVLWGGAFDGIGFHEKGKLFDYKGILTAISLYMFCYCSHPVFPTLYTSMKNKKNFSKVLITCFVISTISYASMALLGYFMFGSKVQSEIYNTKSSDTFNKFESDDLYNPSFSVN
ncbi:hypothetical protein CASFOL_033828 [Castilleja foliolosa]|uniref:Amino acid transporter transmembrane domain-containing protein n=1 Tax=Castilleja foliolosa TaxID=1961234 RepID=A0ABD3BYR4_9LAMI